MPSGYRAARYLPTIDDFEDKFRRVYGREMTSEERHLSNLASILLDEKIDPLEDRRNGHPLNRKFMHV